MSEFNPNEHLRVMKDQDGNPIFDCLEQNGIPVLQSGADGRNHFVMVPRRYLDANGYRQWFYAIYPEGCIEVSDVSPAVAFDATTGKFIEPPVIKVHVSLYTDRSNPDQSLISSSYGMIKPKTAVDLNEGSMGFELAQAIGLKNAMANAGFIYDSTVEIIGDENKFVETAKLGEPVDLVRAAEKTEVTVTENIVSAAAETSKCGELQTAGSASSGILAYMAGNTPCAADDAGSMVNGTSDCEEYIEPQEDKESSCARTVSGEITKENFNVAEEVLVSDAEKNEMTLEDALATIVEVLPDGMAKFGRFAGQAVGEAFDAKLLAYIASHDFTGKLSEATLKAVITLA